MILVTGATGFVGRRVVALLAAAGKRVRALTRSESVASTLPEGVEGAVGDVLDGDSLRRAMEGVEAVVHLVAVIRERGALTFERVNYEGTVGVLAAAQEAGVRRMVCASTIGAASDPTVRYLHSRWMGEQEIIRSGIAYTIVRFSVGFGEGDEFINQLAALVKAFPLVPVVGDGTAVFQPIWVDDAARCIAESLDREALEARTVDIGGPDYFTYDELIDVIAETLGVRAAKAHTPVSLMSAGASVLEALSPRPPITREQLKMLAFDHRTDLDSVQRHFGFEPRPMRGNIDYIRRIRYSDAVQMSLGFMPPHIRDH